MKIRTSLEGKPIRQPSNSVQDQVLYCGGFFSTPGARNGLIRADVLASADQALFASMGISMAANGWIGNREQVLGQAAVVSDLLPEHDAGRTAGLTATPALAGSMFPGCKAAVERLTEELKRRR